MKTFHIVWSTETKAVSTGENYKAISASHALSQWETEHCSSTFICMYDTDITNIAQVSRTNDHLKGDVIH